MDFRLNEEQQALRAAAKDFCSKEVNSTVVRTAFEGPDGDSPEIFKKQAELGWLGITVPDSLGGVGLGPIEQAVVCEELGYVDAPGPYLMTACVAAPALVALGAEDLVGPLLDGSKRATVVWDTDHVVDAQIADGFLVVDGDVARWFGASDVDVTPRASVDGTRRIGRVTLKGTGRELGPSTELNYGMEPGPARVVDAATVYLCAEMVGLMRWALDTTVQYLKDRQAFGVPIGTFQALQHRCADMLVQTESSSSATYYAAYAIANGLPDATFATSIAYGYAADAAHFVTGQCIQLHGGIGYTWEHDAHLYFKRATTNRQLAGSAAFHRERALQLDPGRQ
jgi:alkylation response protein AidB-like acyl-CoA dehydrogenase